MDVQEWVRARLPSSVVHLDVAAAGRVSTQALADEVAHLRREAEVGAYVAQLEAEPVVSAGRERAAGLLGLTGADVALPANALDALDLLLQGWPLGRGGRVGTVPGEYGPNAAVLRRLAADRGWQLVPLPVDDLGRVVGVPGGLDLAVLPQVASQRGVVQPVHDLLADGVPVLLDVAQALGQVPVPTGCAAYVGTSRKWLCGPRGVGLLAVDPAWADRLAPPVWAVPELTGLRRWDAAETHVAGRVGWARAVREWTPELMAAGCSLAASARRLLSETPWTVVEPLDEPTAMTTLLPPPGVDVAQTRLRLIDEGFLTTAVPATRSADLTGPVLRVSTAAWVEPAALTALVAALAG